MGRPWKVADLIPRRDRTYIYLVLGGLATILGLGGLYALGIRLAHLTTDGTVAALDLDSEGSIASWFSVVLLFCSAAVSFVVSRLGSAAWRRMWLVVAAVLCAMSLDEGASVHEAFKELVVRVTGTRLMGDGSIYWAVPYSVLLCSVGGMVLVAMRRDRAAVGCLIGAGGCFAIAAAGQLDWILVGRPAVETWLEESCEMTADLLLLTSLLLHARELVRDSNAVPGSIARVAA